MIEIAVGQGQVLELILKETELDVTNAEIMIILPRTVPI